MTCSALLLVTDDGTVDVLQRISDLDTAAATLQATVAALRSAVSDLQSDLSGHVSTVAAHQP